MTITLRVITESDLPLAEAWLHEPHVARWWLTTTTIADELADIHTAIAGAEPFEVLLVELDGRPIGWCQWYRWWDDPIEAAELEAGPDDLGIDYAVGDPALIGRGVGTELIGALVAHIRAQVTGVAIIVEPDASNTASCRVLAKNGFELVAIRALSFEPEELNAIYRLPLES